MQSSVDVLQQLVKHYTVNIEDGLGDYNARFMYLVAKATHSIDYSRLHAVASSLGGIVKRMANDYISMVSFPGILSMIIGPRRVSIVGVTRKTLNFIDEVELIFGAFGVKDMIPSSVVSITNDIQLIDAIDGMIHIGARGGIRLVLRRRSVVAESRELGVTLVPRVSSIHYYYIPRSMFDDAASAYLAARNSILQYQHVEDS